MQRLMMLAPLLLVTACAATSPVSSADQVCAGWRPIQGEPSDVDVISDKLALSIAGHQEHGRQQGCWQ